MPDRGLPESMKRYVGKKLNKNLIAPSGSLLLKAEEVLTERHAAVFSRLNLVLLESDVDDLAPARRMVDEAMAEVSELFRSAANAETVYFDQIRVRVLPTIRRLTETCTLHHILTALQEKDDYTHKHSIAVAVFSSLIGEWLRCEKDELELLSSAALLHDVGKAQLPAELLTKSGKLSPEEFELVKKHTVLGYEFIRRVPGLSETHAIPALQHHERMDGSGYPHGLTNETHRFSRIIAIADVFHAMLSRRPYKDAQPFYKVVKEMARGAFGLFDPSIVDLFTRKAMESLIGSEVLLSDGRRARIVRVNANDPANPLVMRGEKFIDLARSPDLNIIEA